MLQPSALPATGRRSNVAVQKQAYRPVGGGLPEDFSERLEQFMQASSLGRRELGRLVGVSSYRVREWLRGVAPSGHHLFLLLTIAESLGLRDTLIRPEKDMPSKGAQKIKREAADGSSSRGCRPSV